MAVNTVERSDDKEMKERLSKVDGVKEVYSVYGIYDFCLVVEADTEEELLDIASKRIKPVKGVLSILTLVVAATE